MITELVHLSQESTNNSLQNATRYALCFFFHDAKVKNCFILSRTCDCLGFLLIGTVLVRDQMTQPFLVRQATYIVNLSEFYSYRLIGKLTDFL